MISTRDLTKVYRTDGLEVRALDGLDLEIEKGEFGTLRGWLTENIYQHGSKYTTLELVKRITGGPLTIEPYIRYLREKYGELYKL